MGIFMQQQIRRLVIQYAKKAGLLPIILYAEILNDRQGRFHLIVPGSWLLPPEGNNVDVKWITNKLQDAADQVQDAAKQMGRSFRQALTHLGAKVTIYGAKFTTGDATAARQNHQPKAPSVSIDVSYQLLLGFQPTERDKYIYAAAKAAGINSVRIDGE